MVENRFVGMKSRGVYETPGGAILHFAHRQMESLTMDREVMHLRDSLIPKYSTLVYNGFWFAPERLALQALVTESQKNVTGEVRVKLVQGQRHRRRPPQPGEPLQSADRHDGSRPDAGLQPVGCHRLHRAERPALEGGGARPRGERGIAPDRALKYRGTAGSISRDQRSIPPAMLRALAYPSARNCSTARNERIPW